MTDVRRSLPAVHRLLDDPAFRELIDRTSRARVSEALRVVLASIRDSIKSEAGTVPASTEWVALVDAELRRSVRPSMQRVINATGIVLHTNLGRAPLPRAAVDAIAAVAGGYADVEFDLATGVRGTRNARSRDLLVELTGAEDALVVNNCASALLLAIRALAGGRDVLVSRGELIEIGGSFRIPDIMTQADVRLVEVGTTNRTHLDDYRRALTADTGAVVKVHRSNFTMDGFVHEVPSRDLAMIAGEAGIPLIHDLGSGLMIDLTPWGCGGELTASAAVRDGAGVIVMSGDKLLGGPQAGIVTGKAEWVSRMRSHPLARAVRVDKLTMAALDATLSLYRDPDMAVREIPALAMITAPHAEVLERARAAAATLVAAGIACDVVTTDGAVGGGAFPTARLASAAVRLAGDARQWDVALRSAPTPVVGRIVGGALLLDLRTVQAHELQMLVDSVRASSAT